MRISQDVTAADGKIHSAELISSHRITPASSREEVRQLLFRASDLAFDGVPGRCIRLLAPGQYGNKHHVRLYSIADQDRTGGSRAEFALCVRRCFYIDDFNGEQYEGVASNYLCNLKPGDAIEYVGPVGYPFQVPDDPKANILMIGMGTGIAPFRGLVRRIYDELGGWDGPVRLFYGARSGLEMLYMNEENADLALYYDQPTFQAFRAVSPKPHFGAPPALDAALLDHAAEVWAMLQEERTHLFLAGPQALLPQVDRALAEVAGSAGAWTAMRTLLWATGRGHEMLN